MRPAVVALAASITVSVLSSDPSAAQDLRARIGEAAENAPGDRLARLEERLLGRRDVLAGQVGPDRVVDLLEAQATDLTEHRALELERWSPDGLDEARARECSQARAERQREVRTRREELQDARESLAAARNEREEENARARLARQREHLHRELTKSETILGRACGTEPPGLRPDFVPPGREDHPVFGEYFRPGPPPWAGQPDHPDHPRNRNPLAGAGDEGHPDHPKNKGGKGGRGKGGRGKGKK